MHDLLIEFELKATGETRTIVEKVDANLASDLFAHHYYYTDGSYGCDCNRGALFGLLLPCGDTDIVIIKQFKCGNIDLLKPLWWQDELGNEIVLN